MSVCKNCNTPYLTDAVFCSKCGTRIDHPYNAEPTKRPQTMTVAEAVKDFFQGRVSQGLLYAAVRERRIPHVRLSSGKVLFDVGELSVWWAEELKKSKLTDVRGSLRRIE
jgi:hypothetical protein